MPFATRDLFKQPLSIEELRALVRLVPVRDLFSWKSPIARRRGLAPEGVTDDELLALMAGEPRLIRRPITVVGDRVIIGADAKALAAVGSYP